MPSARFCVAFSDERFSPAPISVSQPEPIINLRAAHHPTPHTLQWIGRILWRMALDPQSCPRLLCAYKLPGTMFVNTTNDEVEAAWPKQSFFVFQFRTKNQIKTLILGETFNSKIRYGPRIYRYGRYPGRVMVCFSPQTPALPISPTRDDLQTRCNVPTSSLSNA